MRAVRLNVLNTTSASKNPPAIAISAMIAPARARFPQGEAAGGSAQETDPRFGKSSTGG